MNSARAFTPEAVRRELIWAALCFPRLLGRRRGGVNRRPPWRGRTPVARVEP